MPIPSPKARRLHASGGEAAFAVDVEEARRRHVASVAVSPPDVAADMLH